MNDNVLLLETATRLFDDLWVPEVVADTGSCDIALQVWQALEDLGFVLISIPEEFGGTGGSLNDAAAVWRAAAKRLVPVPLGETVLAASIFAASGLDVSSELHRQSLPPRTMLRCNRRSPAGSSAAQRAGCPGREQRAAGLRLRV